MADQQGMGNSGLNLSSFLGMMGGGGAVGQGQAPPMSASQMQAIQQQFARQNPAQYGFGQPPQGMAAQAGQKGGQGGASAIGHGQAPGMPGQPQGIAAQAGQKGGQGGGHPMNPAGPQPMQRQGGMSLQAAPGGIRTQY